MKNLWNSIKKFKKNIAELIKRAKEHTSTIVFISPTPIYPNFLQWSERETYDIKDVQKYKEIIKLTCKENKIHFIELFDKLKK